MKKQKRYVTLIEVLIALGLALMLLTTLFGGYRYMTWISQQIDRDKKEVFHQRHLRSRLADVLPRSVSEKAKDFIFCTSHLENGAIKGTSLVFTYDNGVDIHPEFSNHVLARLYVDANDQLCLTTWPSPKRWEGEGNRPMKKEILLTHVQELSFRFFAPPSTWLEEWKQETQQLPPMMEITILEEQQKIAQNPKKTTLVFLLPNSESRITYFSVGQS